MPSHPLLKPVLAHCTAIGPHTGTSLSCIGSMDDAFGADITARGVDYGVVDGET